LKLPTSPHLWKNNSGTNNRLCRHRIIIRLPCPFAFFAIVIVAIILRRTTSRKRAFLAVLGKHYRFAISHSFFLLCQDICPSNGQSFPPALPLVKLPGVRPDKKRIGLIKEACQAKLGLPKTEVLEQPQVSCFIRQKDGQKY
jgi:hypothetical protein